MLECVGCKSGWYKYHKMPIVSTGYLQQN